MDIQPGPRGRAATWHHAEPRFEALGVWTEQKPGLGEDAEPLMLFHRPHGRGLLGVFDGAGGAGAATAGWSASGFLRTNAWVASRAVRGLVEEWFVLGGRTTTLAGGLSARLATLSDGTARRITGTMRRAHPTTLAAVSYRIGDRDVTWEVLWAGDSRCYVAEPDRGLQQLSRDDTESDDALELLVQDPTMTNLVCTGKPFTINRNTGAATLPCVLVCATDGFFGYLHTPAEFEHILLDTLLSAQDGVHWSALITERVTGYTGDDASLCLVALGFSGFAELRAAFRGRAERVRIEHAEPMRSAAAAERDDLVAARTDSWQRYRGGYERRMPCRRLEGQ
ncbi:serine/threonine protein phosphatase [Actinokineospora sp.]|uniref:serine/threonine protein phosphatase n=1 Tax=Actinokineospora sp. TaxID=1872133 RepID=UPI00403823E4